jgi:hypothetical protein
LNPIFWEAAFGVATWSVAAYVAILFVAWMRPLLERLLLTYAVGAIFTLLMQTYARFDQCVGIVACTFSFGKGVVWFDNMACSLDHRPGSELMPLTMRPAGLSSGIDKDRPDYTMYCGEWAVDRIMKAAAKPADASWLWTLAYGQHEDRTPTHGYEATREAAMAAFAKSWGGNSRATARQSLSRENAPVGFLRTRYGHKTRRLLTADPTAIIDAC